MTKLYPIGTQLITFRKSQAALYEEIFGKKLTPLMRVHSKKHNGTEWLVMDSSFSDPSWADAWRVIVTEENQKWLSPVPLFEDLVDVDRNFEINPFYISRYFGDYFKEQRIDPITLKEHLPFWLSAINPETYKRIIERTYPNGQRAPLIEWDEVILPEGAVV